MALRQRQEDAALTPGEIAAALIAIESRRACSTEGRQDTLLKDVLQQVSPDITPEELRKEVSSQRAILAKARRRTQRLRASFASALAAIIVGSVVVSQSSSAPEQPMAPYSLSWPQVQQRILAQDMVQNRPVIRTLAEVPDDHMVRTTDDGVWSAVSEEWPSTGPGLPIDNTPSRMTWRVFKSGKELYVRGWTSERLSPGASKVSPVEVYDTPNAPGLGPTPVQISVRIRPGSIFSPFAAGPVDTSPHDHSWECFNFSSVQTDEHTWEKW